MKQFLFTTICVGILSCLLLLAVNRIKEYMDAPIECQQADYLKNQQFARINIYR